MMPNDKIIPPDALLWVALLTIVIMVAKYWWRTINPTDSKQNEGVDDE